MTDAKTGLRPACKYRFVSSLRAAILPFLPGKSGQARNAATVFD
jgi:hypothetical protein